MSSFTKLYKEIRHTLERHKTEIDIALAALALAAAIPMPLAGLNEEDETEHGVAKDAID